LLDRQSGIEHSFLAPIILMLSLRPDADEKLGQLASIIEAMYNAVQTFRSGLESFHSNVMRP
jgi:hypothetical protein